MMVRMLFVVATSEEENELIEVGRNGEKKLFVVFENIFILGC